MTIINPDVELLPISTSFDEMLNDIEKAACICYGNNKSNLDTLKFLHALHIKNHNRPFEFGTLYINPDLLSTENEDEIKIIDYILESHWTKTNYINNTLYITTNMRVIKEIMVKFYSNIGEVFSATIRFAKKFYKYTENHPKRYTFYWKIARGIADEFRTHVSISSLMQSTRYCCYAKDKFDNQIKICKDQSFFDDKKYFIELYENIEKTYLKAIDDGIPAQMARDLLPLGLYTELIQCAYQLDWTNFFNQRAFDSTGSAHPDAKYIANIAYNKLYNEKNQ